MSGANNILTEAGNIVQGDRQDSYGDIHTSFGQIAEYWDTYVNRKLKMALAQISILNQEDIRFSIEITPMDVANMMILLKTSRAQNKFDRDSYVDIAGYVACAEKLGDL